MLGGTPRPVQLGTVLDTSCNQEAAGARAVEAAAAWSCPGALQLKPGGLDPLLLEPAEAQWLPPVPWTFGPGTQYRDI